jgi:hypothetical protein
MWLDFGKLGTRCEFQTRQFFAAGETPGAQKANSGRDQNRLQPIAALKGALIND